MLEVLIGAFSIFSLIICVMLIGAAIYSRAYPSKARRDTFEQAAKMMCQHCAAGIPRRAYCTNQKDTHVINGQRYGCPSVSLWLEAEK